MIAFIVFSIFLFILLVIGGIVTFVFYQIKNSEANKIAVAALRESPAAHQALGDIQSVGWPIGSFSVEGGGSGKASMSMSVKGSKAKGKYYASLLRVNGLWNLTSGRLELKDGGSIPIAAAPMNGREALIPPSHRVSGGRQLPVNPGAASEWKKVVWPEEGIFFKIPADWMEIHLSRQEVEFRSPDRTAYFIGRATYFDQKIPFQTVLDSLLTRSQGQLARGEISGYAVKTLGRAPGLLEISERGDGATMAAWTGYVDTEQFGTKSITLVLGAPTAADFQKAAPLLGTILDSVDVP
jgi:hypothetical protein